MTTFKNNINILINLFRKQTSGVNTSLQTCPIMHLDSFSQHSLVFKAGETVKKKKKKEMMMKIIRNQTHLTTEDFQQVRTNNLMNQQPN